MSSFKVNTEMYMDDNGAGIFDKYCTLGNSVWTDKYRTDMKGFVQDNKVYQYNLSYNEETDVTEEDNILLKECTDKAEAIEFAKQYFGVTKIID